MNEWTLIRDGYFKNVNSRKSSTSHFSDAMWEMGCKHSQYPLPFTSQVGCGKISRPDILDWEVGSLKVGSGTQTRIPVYKISYSGSDFTTLDVYSGNAIFVWIGALVRHLRHHCGGPNPTKTCSPHCPSCEECQVGFKGRFNPVRERGGENKEGGWLSRLHSHRVTFGHRSVLELFLLWEVALTKRW